jgi:hypothetical protein
MSLLHIQMEITEGHENDFAAIDASIAAQVVEMA